MLQYELMIRGRVQGVGFRYYVQQQAQLLEVTGVVWNGADDRSVSVVAQGEEDVLKVFVQRCEQGPSLSHVESVDVRSSSITSPLQGFEIRR